MLGRFEEAERCLDEVLNLYDDLSPTSALMALSNKGSLYWQQGQLEKALSCYDKVLAQNPVEVATLANKGRILLSMKRIDEAREVLKSALKIDPWNYTVISNLLQVQHGMNITHYVDLLERGLKTSLSPQQAAYILMQTDFSLFMPSPDLLRAAKLMKGVVDSLNSLPLTAWRIVVARWQGQDQESQAIATILGVSRDELVQLCIEKPIFAKLLMGALIEAKRVTLQIKLNQSTQSLLEMLSTVNTEFKNIIIEVTNNRQQEIIRGALSLLYVVLVAATWDINRLDLMEIFINTGLEFAPEAKLLKSFKFVVLFLTDQFQEALEYFDGIKSDSGGVTLFSESNDNDLMWMRGESLRRLGHIKEAIECFEGILKEEPNRQDAQQSLSICWKQL